MTGYHDATSKKAKKSDGKALARVGHFKCPRCKKVRGSSCGFDKKSKRFHMMNRHCGTLEKLKEAMKDVGRPFMDGERTGYFSFYQAEINGTFVVAFWKNMFERFLCAAEVQDGKLVPMRLSTAEAILDAASRHYTVKYEDGDEE